MEPSASTMSSSCSSDAPSVEGVPPVARSNSSRPSSTLIVEWKDDRVDPVALSQFQPPSGCCSLTSRATNGAMSTLPELWPAELGLPKELPK